MRTTLHACCGRRPRRLMLLLSVCSGILITQTHGCKSTRRIEVVFTTIITTWSCRSSPCHKCGYSENTRTLRNAFIVYVTVLLRSHLQLYSCALRLPAIFSPFAEKLQTSARCLFRLCTRLKNGDTFLLTSSEASLASLEVEGTSSSDIMSFVCQVLILNYLTISYT